MYDFNNTKTQSIKYPKYIYALVRGTGARVCDVSFS